MDNGSDSGKEQCYSAHQTRYSGRTTMNGVRRYIDSEKHDTYDSDRVCCVTHASTMVDSMQWSDSEGCAHRWCGVKMRTNTRGSRLWDEEAGRQKKAASPRSYLELPEVNI